MTQVWTAMCIYLILSYIKFANRIAWRLSEILRLLQLPRQQNLWVSFGSGRSPSA